MSRAVLVLLIVVAVIVSSAYPAAIGAQLEDTTHEIRIQQGTVQEATVRRGSSHTFYIHYFNDNQFTVVGVEVTTGHPWADRKSIMFFGLVLPGATTADEAVTISVPSSAKIGSTEQIVYACSYLKPELTDPFWWYRDKAHGCGYSYVLRVTVSGYGEVEDLFDDCLIATATYGSELAPEVQFLREFRDERIMQTFAGSSFMVVFNAWYYSFSPRVAEYEWTHQDIRGGMRMLLYPLMGVLHLASLAYSAFGFEPELATLVSGILAASLIGLVYLSLPVTGLLWLLRERINMTAARRVAKWHGMLIIILLAGFIVSQFLTLFTLMVIVTAGIVLTSLLAGGILPALCIIQQRFAGSLEFELSGEA